MQDIRVALPGSGYSSRKSSATQSSQCVRYFRVSERRYGCQLAIFNVRTYVKACDCTRGLSAIGESALKADFGRKIPCRTGESNLPQRRAGSTLYKLSYIPSLINFEICVGSVLFTLIVFCQTKAFIVQLRSSIGQLKYEFNHTVEPMRSGLKLYSQNGYFSLFRDKLNVLTPA